MNKDLVTNSVRRTMKTPSPKRIFLGWDVPLVIATCNQLIADPPRSKRLDLSDTTLVFPVTRAKQQCAKCLQELATLHKIDLELPWFATIGELPERLYEATEPLAGEMQQTLAWSHVLSRCSDDELRPLIPPGLSRDSIVPWTDLGSSLRRLVEEIAVDNIWPEDVVSRIEDPRHQSRWSLIASLRARYLAELRTVGLSDPLESRRSALREGRCHTQKRLVFVGCVDLGKLLSAMASQACEVAEIWIGAPDAFSGHFDDWGRVEAQQWLESFLEVDDDSLISAGSAEEQSAAATAVLQLWESNGDSNNIAIGITDDTFAPLVETDLELIGRYSHWTAGTPIPQTAIGKLLSRISEFVLGQSWGTLASLVRHSDVLATFAPSRSIQVLGGLDHLRSEHFPHHIDAPVPEKYARLPVSNEVCELRTQILQWLAPLLVSHISLAGAARALQHVIHSLYDQPSQHPHQDHRDPYRETSIELVDRILEAISQLPDRLDISVSPHVAIQMLISRMASQHVIPASDGRSVTIAGWLELVFDEADRTIVIGMNHPFVPQAISGDPFLPGSLRSLLGITDNDRRYARDAYIFQNLVKSRSRIAIIVGRRGTDESPTPPSRLLASCSASQVLTRTIRFLDAPPNAPSPLTRWDVLREDRDLPIPAAVSGARLNAISVTAFRDYLTCPFRFYLRHILKMRPRDDMASELAANQFGDLVHAAVEYFGNSDTKNCLDSNLIAENMLDHLHSYAKSLYGSKPNAPIRIQIAQAAKRLQHVAKHQASRAQEGWTIHSVEDAVFESHGASIEIDNETRLLLKGRVDRIDYHPETKKWAILDYKTHGHKPFDKHYDSKNNIWLDLQLPLYLFMLEALNINADPSDVSLGYFNIAERELDSGVHIAEFTPALLLSAHAEARRVAASIVEGDFTPQLDATKIPYDDYAMILQTGIRLEFSSDDSSLIDI